MDDTMKGRAHTLFQQTLLGDAAEHAHVALMVWNAELRYVAVNERACTLLGVTREVLLGARVGDQNPTESAQASIAASLDRLPAAGRTELPSGVVVDWMTVETDIAGLPHILGVMWPAETSP